MCISELFLKSFINHTGLIMNPHGNSNDICRKDFQIPMQYKARKVKEAFSFLRVLHAQGNEFSNITQGHGLELEDIPPLSIGNEVEALNTLRIAALESLGKFPDSLEHDNELLKDELEYPLRNNKRNIIVMRRGEKKVLTFYAKLSEICGPLYQMKFRDLTNKIGRDTKFQDNDSPLRQYINHVVIPLVQRESNCI